MEDNQNINIPTTNEQGYIIENIVKIFVFDTFVCSINGLQLLHYQTEKHGWPYETWLEMFTLYRNNLGKIKFQTTNE